MRNLTLFLSVPEVGEGRWIEVLSNLEGSAIAVVDLRLFDVSSDVDQRTDLTLACQPDTVEEVLMRLFEKAVHRIDLARHDRVRPRVGAVDVVPLMRLYDTTMGTAVIPARLPEAGR